MQSKAKTVEQYLAELPEDRRAHIQAVREVILKNLDKDYREGMQYGGIGYFVPHEVFGPGYHCDPRQPLPFAGLGQQKHHLSMGFMCTYWNSPLRRWFEDAWKKTGKKLDMGAACIRFKSAADVPLEVVGELVRRVPAKVFVEQYINALAMQGKGPDGKPLKSGGGAGGGKRAEIKSRNTSRSRTGAKAGSGASKKVGKKVGKKRVAKRGGAR